MALTLPSTTRSPNGLTQLVAAINNVSTTGADALTQITPGGLTIFAAVDDAWTGEAWAQVSDKTLSAKLIGNHVSSPWPGISLTLVHHQLHVVLARLGLEPDQRSDRDDGRQAQTYC
jgi:hypothetical protein